MKSFLLSTAFFILSLASLSPAQARISNHHSGDMFYDRNWIYDRPSVPSDKGRGKDMFRKVPLMYNSNADMFGRANRKNNIGRDDMFPHRWVVRVPDYPLTIDPPQGPYNVR